MSSVRNYHYAGQVIRLSANFRNEDGNLTDPDSITLLVISPDGEEVSHSPTRDSEGRYHFDLYVVDSGRYQYRWHGEGMVQAAAEWEFLVRRSSFTI